MIVGTLEEIEQLDKEKTRVVMLEQKDLINLMMILGWLLGNCKASFPLEFDKEEEA